MEENEGAMADSEGNVGASSLGDGAASGLKNLGGMGEIFDGEVEPDQSGLFEINSWKAMEEAGAGAGIEELLGCNPLPDAQELEDSYWDQAEENGLFMETTAACFPAEFGTDEHLGVEEQSIVQVILNISNHADGQSLSSAEAMQIPLLALDLPDPIFCSEQSEVSLDGIPLFLEESFQSDEHFQRGEHRSELLEVREEESSISFVFIGGERNFTAEDGSEGHFPEQSGCFSEADQDGTSGFKIEEIISSPEEQQQVAESVVDSCSLDNSTSDSVGCHTHNSYAGKEDDQESELKEVQSSLVMQRPKTKRKSSAGGNPKKKQAKKAPNLPEASVGVLRDWLLRHLEYPYPNSAKMERLAKSARLNVGQVTSWMSNARSKYHLQKFL